MLYDAVLVRKADRMRLERDRAVLEFNLTCFDVCRGKDMTYWDVAGHLYPKDFVQRQRQAIMTNRMRAEQIETLEAIKQHMILTEEQDWQRRHRHAKRL